MPLSPENLDPEEISTWPDDLSTTVPLLNEWSHILDDSESLISEPQLQALGSRLTTLYTFLGAVHPDHFANLTLIKDVLDKVNARLAVIKKSRRQTLEDINVVLGRFPFYIPPVIPVVTRHQDSSRSPLSPLPPPPVLPQKLSVQPADFLWRVRVTDLPSSAAELKMPDHAEALIKFAQRLKAAAHHGDTLTPSERAALGDVKKKIIALYQEFAKIPGNHPKIVRWRTFCSSVMNDIAALETMSWFERGVRHIFGDIF